MEKRRIAILGSTGSIGRQALDVIRQHRDLFEVELLTANNSSDLLIQQAVEFDANAVVICNEEKYREVKEALDPHYIKVFAGMQSVCDLVTGDNIDITAPAGSVVKATLDGTVIFAGWSDDSGHTIQIQHDGDIVSIYKHNEKLLKKAGDKVTAGSPIALVGNSGELTTGDHLHFELWHKGEAVDPTRYINF